MSDVIEFLNEEIKPICDDFFDNHSHQHDLTTNQGCGEYMEDLVEHLRALGHVKVGHLKKNPGQTQWNGHANDALLYRQGDLVKYRAVDCIAAAESTDPLKPPSKNFGIDEPRYTDADWTAKPQGEPVPTNTVPYTPYQGDAINSELKRTLAYDYARRPQGVDWDVSVWAFRIQHSALMGPIPPSAGGHPLGMGGAIEKHRPEWCSALSVPVVPVPSNWQIGDPV